MVQTAPVRKVALGPSDAIFAHREDGAILIRSPHALAPYPAKLTERLVHWARVAPERIFMAQRGATETWRTLSYAEALRHVRAIGQALLARGVSGERPVAILSENDLEHALLALAAMHVGIPYAPISPAYSLVSTDHAKLRFILELLTPGLVFAARGDRYAKALAAAVPAGTQLVVTEAPAAGHATTLFGEFLTCAATEAVDRAYDSVGPHTVAKILFTSGSTGQPKGVINTQRMLCSNQEMLAAALPCLRETPPIIVDWLPWNHTFGSNHNVGLVLYNGGTLYIDDGKPLPGVFERTVRNLREIAPTVYFNVPRGFEELVPYLRREPALRERFFSRLGMLFYAGAGLSQPVWDAFEELAAQTCGERILWITGLGATETAPLATCANWEAGRSGMIGLPAVGQEMKLVPVGDKLEARFRGANVTPGYWRQPELTRAAFDDEGYYKMGDAVRFADPVHPEKGLLFDGRLAEDFKLSSGTWASVGALRTRFIAAGAPYVLDVVIAGHDRDYIAALVFPRLDDCRRLCPQLPTQAPAAEVLSHPAVRRQFQDLLGRLAGEATGSATRIERALLLEVPPSIDASELTDKGSINQRAVLEHRAELVDELYSQRPPARVICSERHRAMTPSAADGSAATRARLS
ncbi:MAG TPA: feruloyl-CoA synthase [Burkholderiales bacterium]|nr:feruloyl-CoA synthase [Burkholderiales bacterium]